MVAFSTFLISVLLSSVAYVVGGFPAILDACNKYHLRPVARGPWRRTPAQLCGASVGLGHRCWDFPLGFNFLELALRIGWCEIAEIGSLGRDFPTSWPRRKGWVLVAQAGLPLHPMDLPGSKPVGRSANEWWNRRRNASKMGNGRRSSRRNGRRGGVDVRYDARIGFRPAGRPWRVFLGPSSRRPGEHRVAAFDLFFRSGGWCLVGCWCPKNCMR